MLNLIQSFSAASLLTLISQYSYAAPVTYISELSVKSQGMSEFLDLVYAELSNSRGFEGNLQFDIYIDPRGQDKVIFIERWESPADQDRYFTWRTERGDFEKLGKFFSEPPKTRLFRDVLR